MSDLRRIRIISEEDWIDQRYGSDIAQITSALARKGYAVDNSEAKHLWRKYSDSMCANWKMVPDDDDEILNAIRPYFEEIEEQQ